MGVSPLHPVKAQKAEAPWPHRQDGRATNLASDNAQTFVRFFRQQGPPMLEPKKETVRTALPSRPDETPSANAPKHDTVRIVLPSRTPVAPRRLPPKIMPLPAADSATKPPISPRRPPVLPHESIAVSPLLQPLPKPPGPDSSAESGAAITPLPTASEPRPAASIHPGPKQETARISILPRPAPAAKPAINMPTTQPIPGGVQPAPVIVTSKPLDPFEALPRSFCWGLFGIAALIFLIQIWNYVVS